MTSAECHKHDVLTFDLTCGHLRSFNSHISSIVTDNARTKRTQRAKGKDLYVLSDRESNKRNVLKLRLQGVTSMGDTVLLDQYLLIYITHNKYKTRVYYSHNYSTLRRRLPRDTSGNY